MRKIYFLILPIILLFISCGQDILYHSLSEREANEIAVILDQYGIRSDKIPDEVRGRGMVFNIVVSRGDRSRSLEILNEKGLPRETPAGIHEIFGSSSLIPTITEERAKYQAAIQGEIERTLLGMHNVISARVHLVLPDMDGLDISSGKIIPKASVFVKYYQGLQQAAVFTETDIKNIVAGSVLELKPDNVNVVLQRVQPADISAPASDTISFLFFRIAPESKRNMQIGLIIVLSVLFLMIFVIIVLFTKIKELKTSLNIIKYKK